MYKVLGPPERTES